MFSVPSTGLASLQPLSIAKKRFRTNTKEVIKKLFLLRTFFGGGSFPGNYSSPSRKSIFPTFLPEDFFVACLAASFDIGLSLSLPLSLSISLSRCSLPLSANFSEKQAEALDQSQGASVRLFCSLDFYILTSIRFTSERLLRRLFPHL